MPDEFQARDLRTLVAHVKEHLSYLQELGVERLERPPNTAGPQRNPVQVERESKAPPLASAEESALRRNALAAESYSGSSQPDAFQPDTTTYAEDSRSNLATQSSRTPKRSSEREPVPVGTLFEAFTSQDQTGVSTIDETLEDIWSDIGDCTRCPLYEGRTHIVHTEGNRRARLMFVGEAPGADEDLQARPFVGRAGQLLNKIIEGIGLKRDEVLIGNVNRCRPPGNRAPTHAEAATCKPFLLREIELVRPDVIVVLGNTAMKNLLDTKDGITKLRGRFLDYKGIKVMPTFHPAYLLRDPSKKRETWEDMKMVRDYLSTVTSDK
jgi:uracil-DNA glycosylase